MAAQSTLKNYANDFSIHYIQNQPKYQRLMMTAFSFYVLISTYKGLSPKKKLKKVVPVVSGGSSEKQNSTSPVVIEENSIGKGNRKRKRIPRVEVSILI